MEARMGVQVIEIGGHSTHPIGKKMSNFTERPFVFDGIRCASVEGILQALKCSDRARQIEICQLSGRAAKRAGKEYDTWKEDKKLYWNGNVYLRTSRDYTLLITRIYDELYAQNPELREELLALYDANIWHSIGKPDMRETVLTEIEMLMQLWRLRHRALFEQVEKLVRP